MIYILYRLELTLTLICDTYVLYIEFMTDKPTTSQWQHYSQEK